MTRTAAADAVVSACPRTVASCPPAVGTAIACTGPAAKRPSFRRPGRPGRARLPFLCHLPGAPQPGPRPARPLHRSPVPGNAAPPDGWPADPGRDVS
jgi:hypothetical protein